MWTRPAVAGAAIVTGLALGVGAGGASRPVDTSSTMQVDQPGRDHDNGQNRGHGKPDEADRRGQHEKADKAEKAGKACISPARYTGGPLGPCPRKPHPHGKVVPVGPGSYSETEE